MLLIPCPWCGERDVTEFHCGGEAHISRPTDADTIDDATWASRKNDWLPSAADGDFIASLMKPVTEPGEFASWISAPKVGIDNKPGDFEYVKVAA